MLLFLCPYCRDTLKIKDEYLGQRGRCNHCGGRIALLGKAGHPAPQMATKIADDVKNDDTAETLPLTEKQRELLKKLGTAEADIQQLDREKASERIDALLARQRASEGPTDKQLEWLRKQGVSEEQLQELASKAAASELIESMHLQPTQKQIEYLHDLGATGAQIARLKSRAEASVLIDQLLHGR